jgi:hypothetical protein
MDKFTPTNLEVIRKDINAAIQSIAEKHGITLHVGHGSYTSASVTFKLEGKLSGNSEAMVSQNKSYAIMLGLPENIVGSTFTSQGKKMKITGLNPKKPKYAIEVKDIDTGKGYGFSLEGIKGLIARGLVFLP